VKLDAFFYLFYSKQRLWCMVKMSGVKALFVAVVALFGVCGVYAQEPQSVPFNGLVKDASGAPLAKIKIELKGVGVYTYSDKEGRFGFTNVQSDDVLVFIKKRQTVEVPVEGRRSMQVVLLDGGKSQAEESAELIDTGFGYVKKREYTNSSGTISGEFLRRMGTQDLESAIVGRVAGVTMLNGEIIIRNTGKVNATNASQAALILVDGSEVARLSMVNVQDVESVTVLKDGTIYGMRGANGVILIKTRSGNSK
jgi:TonB-dependent SusC/RagA subfamily outer membrane receptor